MNKTRNRIRQSKLIPDTYILFWFRPLYQTNIILLSYKDSYNILYSYADNDYISEALAIKNCIAGVVGFGAALVAGKLLSFVQQNGNSFFGVSMFGQQLLSGVSFVLALLAFAYVRFVLSKQKKVE